MKTTINERVRQLRLAAGRSQAEFANDIEASMSLLSKIEAGTKEVTPKMVDKINSAYEIKPPTWLYDGKGELLFTRPMSKGSFDPATDTLYKELKVRIERQDTIIDRLTRALLGNKSFRIPLNQTAQRRQLKYAS